ncbi:DNA-binding protein [Pseudoxanthomonas mexicana]|uniref:DNA-binding protein n=1 Tax=Pseudoxanthomonas mexicana TaxID=128785 RepID=UPI0028AD61AF|nr:DNA-binding protein [Pseudoxanthomonas mexicana]
MGKDLRSIAQLVRGSLYTESQIRTWVTKADKNGLAPAVTRAGRSILVDAEMFYAWREQEERRRRGTPVVNTMGVNA